ncbi:DUF4198 domain-containing protein [Herminiimonas contaminans]|uniref:DUF4198 domain-containing protein n=1 Tax=Herminiimonas contaminans TaxID=1111140 RepID=A0ABS0ET28_9BURK|nr:DUF4198 domain-containing protein [Herminiimonas contaminans]MBF8177875.1 DUF4198 domain-containing protein [Herminiimonas contaminans]
MKKTSLWRVAALAVSLSVALPMAANAHRAWMLPSATVLSGNEPWVTVDAAVSNDLFYFEHNPLRLDGLAVIAPDGSAAAVENKSTGKYRSTFDVKLAQKGTYKLTMVNDGLSASYKVGTENKRWRGSAETFAKEVPADAKDLNVSRNQSRMEVFVSSGKPSDTVLKPTGAGLELVPITHPNDLFAGDTSNFRFLLDGKPAADIEVTVIPGGIRYRDQLGEIKVKTDKDGKFSVKWPSAGMYWMSANNGSPQMGTGSNAQKAVGTLAKPIRRVSYTATLEVLQP